MSLLLLFRSDPEPEPDEPPPLDLGGRRRQPRRPRIDEATEDEDEIFAALVVLLA